MTAESLKQRALKACADAIKNTDATDPLEACQWADTALALVKVANEADILARAAS